MRDTKVESGSNAGLLLSALGPLDCRWAGESLRLGGAKQQMVLALLLLEANRAVSVDRLLAWVWTDDAEPRNVGTLHVYVSNWRRELALASRVLGRQIIATRRPGYVLQLDAPQSDVMTFEALRVDGETALVEGRAASAVGALRAALNLWRGEPLAGLPVGPSATARLSHAKVTVMERLAEAELTLGRHREVTDELQNWVREHPLNEALRGHLMLALYRCGRQADALATCREARHLLVEELGIDPSRGLQDLEMRILDQDPSLEALGSLAAIGVGETTAVRPSVVGPAAVLEFDDRVVPIDRAVFTIGRLADRHLMLDDVGVSRVHAEIRRSSDSFVIADVGSVNGTVVNGRREVLRVLEDGDVVRLGGVEMTFRLMSS